MNGETTLGISARSLKSDRKCRDMAARIATLQEAGRFITTANPPKDHVTASIEDVKLGGCLYPAIR